jgi:broad specificity phosphatase PhoE
VQNITSHFGLQVVTDSKEFTNLLGPALPALQHVTVDLRGGDVGDGGLFTGLLLCQQLSTLHLEGFSVSPAAVQTTAAVLAQLSALRDLRLESYHTCNPADLVEQLTCLTALDLYVHDEMEDGDAGEYSVQSMFTAAAHNPALQIFKVCPGWFSRPTAAEVQHLLEACPSLSELHLGWMTLAPDAVVVLLTHGTTITTLTAHVFETTASLADKPCSWKCLQLQGDYPTVLHLANLPLKGLSSLQWATQWATGLATLELPLATVPAEDLPHLLQRAATNLAACPAWKAQPRGYISLEGDPSDYNTANIIDFSPQQRIQLVQALAPLGGPHVRTFVGSIRGAEFEWGRAEVEALARSLGSKEVTTLELSHCTLATDFWAALDEFLPSLNTLRFRKDVRCAPLDLAIFCTKRGQRHFTLQLGQALYNEVGGGQLGNSLAAQGVPHVTCLLV